MRQYRTLVLLAVLGTVLPLPARSGADPGETAVVDESGDEVRKGSRIRVDPVSGKRFTAHYLLQDADSLRVTTEDGRTESLSRDDIARLEVFRGTRERVHPVLYVLAGAAFVTGAVIGYIDTEDKSDLVRGLAVVGYGVLGVWFVGMVIPHGGGMQTVEVWVTVPLGA